MPLASGLVGEEFAGQVFFSPNMGSRSRRRIWVEDADCFGLCLPRGHRDRGDARESCCSVWLSLRKRAAEHLLRAMLSM